MTKRKNPMYPNWEDGGKTKKKARNWQTQGGYREGKGITYPAHDWKPYLPIGVRAPQVNETAYKYPILTNNPSPSDESVRSWTEAYTSSPKYLERLKRSGYPNAEQEQKDRLYRLSNASIYDTERRPTMYDDDRNNISINNRTLTKRDDYRDVAVAHELSHVNLISGNDEKRILRKNKQYNASKITEYTKQATSNNVPLSMIMEYRDHDNSPNESKADMDAFRYLLHKKGIYNAGKQDMSKDILNKALKDKDISNTMEVKRLREHFADDDIVELMNTVAYNNNKQSNTMAKNGKKIKNSYAGKKPPAYQYGGFVNGNMFEDDYPQYIPNYNGVNGIPPMVYEFGGTAPSDAIPVQGPFPYQTYGTQSGYGQIPPPKVYANGGIVPTSNSFAGSPFPRDYMYETYPSYVSEYPQSPTDPVAYLSEAASGITLPGSIGPGDPPGDTTLGRKPIIGAVDIYGNVVGTPSMTKTGTAINNEVQDQARLQYIMQLSKKYGVPTNKIYSKRARRYDSAYQDVDNKYMEYELEDPKTHQWITLRQNFDDKNVGYPVGAYRTANREDGGYIDPAYAKSGIKIKPENRGKFNATKKRTGKTTEELTHSKNPTTRKRAIFAQNASKWNKADNGGGPYGDILPVYNPMNINTNLQNAPVAPYSTSPVPQTGVAPFSDDEVAAEGNYEQQSNGRGIASAIGGALGNMTFNTAGPIMGLGAISNAFTAQQNAINTSAQQTRRNITQGPVYNPYKYGTGSTSLFDNGGSIVDDNSIQQALMTLRQAGYDIQMD
jgi:hypothetical protein